MAIRASNPGGGTPTTQTDHVYRTSIPSLITFTEMMWVSLAADNNAVSMFSYRNPNGTDAEWIAFGVNSTGTTLWIETHGGSTTGSDLALDTWHHVALVKDGNNYAVYLDGRPDIIRSDASTFAGVDRWYLFGFHDSGSSAFYGSNARFAAYKIWSGGALSRNEIMREMVQYEPVRVQHLYSYVPFDTNDIANFRDLSTNGNNWTGYAGNSFTIQPGPPIPYRAMAAKLWSRGIYEPAAPAGGAGIIGGGVGSGAYVIGG